MFPIKSRLAQTTKSRAVMNKLNETGDDFSCAAKAIKNKALG